jgi:hypothetical protein
MTKKEYEDAITGVKLWTPEENLDAFSNNEQTLRKILNSNIEHSKNLGFISGETMPPNFRGEFISAALEKAGIE